MYISQENQLTKRKVILSIVWFLIASCIGMYLLYHDTWSKRKDAPVSTYETNVVPQVVSNGNPEVAYVDGKLDLNTATKEQLMTLPRIGEVMAERIVAFRSKQPFKQIRDLKKIQGIGEKTFQNLTDYVCVIDTQ